MIEEGRTTVFKLEQTANEKLGIDVIEEGTLKYTVVRDGSCCKDGIVETNGGILMLVSDMQPMNAALVSADTESGKVMAVRILQLEKAWFAIVVKEEG